MDTNTNKLVKIIPSKNLRKKDICNNVEIVSDSDSDSDYDSDIISKLAAKYRGDKIRKKLSLNENSITLDIIQSLLNDHINTRHLYDKINKNLTKKKIRNANFPSPISENIARLAILKHTKGRISPSWDTKKGDLCILDMQIEVKCFSTDSPSSFGPKESWNVLCFVDAIKFMSGYFEVYLVYLSNTSQIWRNIQVSTTQTYQDQCGEGRRPRFYFDRVVKQIPQKYVKKIFAGDIKDLQYAV